MNKLKNTLAKVLEIDSESINDETSPDNVPSWDSFNGLVLASELEATFKVKFTMADISGVKKVKDIKLALARHGVKLDE